MRPGSTIERISRFNHANSKARDYRERHDQNGTESSGPLDSPPDNNTGKRPTQQVPGVNR